MTEEKPWYKTLNMKWVLISTVLIGLLALSSLSLGLISGIYLQSWADDVAIPDNCTNTPIYIERKCYTEPCPVIWVNQTEVQNETNNQS